MQKIYEQFLKIMKKLIFLALLALSLNAIAQSSGKILARWSDGWYVATIVEKVGQNYKVIYDDDGVEAIVPPNGIKALDWTAGSRVQCNWKGRGFYYPGTIAQMSGIRVNINYDDGDKETTLIGRCRTR